MNTETDFEQWAKLLLARKVPQNSLHLIDSETIQCGANILKQGEAFEVHIEALGPLETSTGRVFVTPLPRLFRATAN